VGVVVQVSVSEGGVPKRATESGRVGRLGIAGDKHLYSLHGGPRKALLLMAAEVIETLRDEGFPVYFGALGENLTVSGLPYAEWRSGQKYRVGTALIELTETRATCRKLNPYGSGIQKRISHPGESGFYAAVLEEGVIRAGDRIQLAHL
jgi:MOSC domain-containing protein YiiM